MPTKLNTFTKEERLCSKKRIEQLFTAGSHSLSAFPLRAVWNLEDRDGMPCQLLISVSKRRQRHAVDRNRLKRLVREAFRIHKHALYETLGQRRMNLAILWTGDQLMPFATVERKLQNLLQRIIEELNQPQES